MNFYSWIININRKEASAQKKKKLESFEHWPDCVHMVTVWVGGDFVSHA